jgi:hypothetical protein
VTISQNIKELLKTISVQKNLFLGLTKYLVVGGICTGQKEQTFPIQGEYTHQLGSLKQRRLNLNKEKVPCEDCICLPVCLSRMSVVYKQKQKHLLFSINAIEKCEIIKKFLTFTENTFKNPENYVRFKQYIIRKKLENRNERHTM